MKILVGVDNDGHYKTALNLVARLRFENPSWVLAYSVDLSLPVGDYDMASVAALGLDYVKLANEAGHIALEHAKDHACGHGINAETILLNGNAATALVQHVDRIAADLVCVHSERKGRLGSFFLGSVSRGLAIGSNRSVLISKGSIAPTGALNVVFATDHSEYANRALNSFIAMRPSGVKSIKVVTALHLNEQGSHFNILSLDSPIEKWLTNKADWKNEDAVSRLRDAGYSCCGEVYNRPVNEAIHDAMTSTQADLLVMGAQGHGFMHRVLLGSTALHQVVIEPYPVLIIRP